MWRSRCRSGRRLTRDWFRNDPPSADDIRQLRQHVRTEIAAAGR